MDDTLTRTRATTGMVWGLKPSFLDYLGRLPGTESAITRGAGTTATGEFYFELRDTSAFDRATGSGTLKFHGSVSFRAHYGLLAVEFSDPWLEVGEGRTVLTIADGSDRLPLVEVIMPEEVAEPGRSRWTSLPTALLPGAVDLFNGAYSPGEAFAPLHIRLSDRERGTAA